MGNVKRTLVGVICLLLASCTAAPPDPIDQVGYFKADFGEIRQRAMTFTFPAGVSEAVVKQHAQGLPYSPGGVTVAFYYSSTPAAKDPTRLARFDRVLDLLEGSEWRFRYQKSLNGSESFKAR